MAEYETLTLDVSPQGVAYVLLNRPEKHNAFNAQVIAELSDAFETLRGSNARVMFLRGAGQSFSAGGDLEWMKAAARYSRDENLEDALALAEMLRKLHDLPMMTVALVHGAAMGGGVGLVAACDIGVAVKTAHFRFSEVRLGLTPATISPFVIQAIGPRLAKALFVSGEGFDAPYSEKIGLTQYTVDDLAGLDTMAEHLANLAMSTAPGAVADAKTLVADVAGLEIDAGLSRMTAAQIANRRASVEGQEGVAAFLERRKPGWLN